MGFQLVFIGSRGQGFELSFCPWSGEFAHKKPLGVLPRGGEWSGLELTDT